jgi:hypothetical protein
MREQIGLQCLPATCSSVLVIALGTCSGCSTGSPRAAPRDSGVELSLERDADAESSGDDAGCHPGNVSGFKPPAFVPIRRSTPCNGFNGDGGLVQAYGDACIGHSKNYDACAGFVVADAAGAADCYGCLVTSENPDASTYGAVVYATTPLVDYPGCLQFFDPTDAGASCAQLITSAATCSEFACKPACPISSMDSWSAFLDCYNVTTNGACAGYWLSALGCIASEEGDGGNLLASVCFGGATTEDDYLSIAHHFCGGD